jgi:hypothetical protein
LSPRTEATNDEALPGGGYGGGVGGNWSDRIECSPRIGDWSPIIWGIPPLENSSKLPRVPRGAPSGCGTTAAGNEGADEVMPALGAAGGAAVGVLAVGGSVSVGGAGCAPPG